MNAPERTIDVEPIVDWLVGGEATSHDAVESLGTLGERLLERGVHVDRMAVFVRPLHPNVAARAFYWRNGSEKVEMNEEAHAFMSTDEQLASPIHVVVDSRTEIRCRLNTTPVEGEYPVLEELRADGFTDYLITPLEFVGGEVNAWSLATRAKRGFSDAELAALARIKPAFARIVEIHSLIRKAATLLDAYLGSHAGSRVLQGRIRRGDAESLHAVIWFCDLRDSTVIAESMDPRDYLSMLNAYFECVLAPVQTQGGEVLSFIGDAALAIFPVGDDVADAAARAVAAATQSIEDLRVLNERRPLPLRFSIGLHVGEVLYGNVGTPTRIQFTVVGSAANEAARIESLCKSLDVSLLVSEGVARHARTRKWRSVGTHRLRGVDKPVELFTLGDQSAD